MADVSVPSGLKHIVVVETHLNNDTKKEGVSEQHPEGSTSEANDINSKSETDQNISTNSAEPEVVVVQEQTTQAASKEQSSSASGSESNPLANPQVSNHKDVGKSNSDSQIIVDILSKRKQSVTPTDVSYPSTSKHNASETNSAPDSISRKSLKSILKTRSESQIILNMPILNPERHDIIGKFTNGTSVDDGGVTGVRFELETELSGTANTKRKRKSGKFKTVEPKIASFVNPAFEQEDQAINYKFADLVEQLLGHGTDDQADSHPYGRKACRGGNGRAFMDSGKSMIWFVLMIAMLGAIGGIIFLSETRKRIPVYLTNLTLSATTNSNPTDFS